MAGSALVIAGDHDGVNPQLMKRGNGGFRVLFDGVGHGDNASGAVSGGHQHGGLALIFQSDQRLFQVAQFDVRLIEKPAAADANMLVVHPALHPAGGNGPEVSDGRNIQAFLPGTGYDGLPQRVFGARFHRRRESKHVALIEVGGGNHVGEGGLAFGDGAGLVEDHGLDVFEGLNGFAGTDQYTGFGAQSRAHHDGGGCGEPQGTGAGDDQDGNGR